MEITLTDDQAQTMLDLTNTEIWKLRYGIPEPFMTDAEYAADRDDRQRVIDKLTAVRKVLTKA